MKNQEKEILKKYLASNLFLQQLSQHYYQSFLIAEKDPLKKIIDKKTIDQLLLAVWQQPRFAEFKKWFRVIIQKIIQSYPKGINLEKIFQELELSGPNELFDQFIQDIISEETLQKLVESSLAEELFIEIIRTSILTFNKKVNLLFGSLTQKVLDKQLTPFIELFIPTLQQKLLDFLNSPSQQKLMKDLLLVLKQQLLSTELPLDEAFWLKQLKKNKKSKVPNLIELIINASYQWAANQPIKKLIQISVKEKKQWCNWLAQQSQQQLVQKHQLDFLYQQYQAIRSLLI